MLPSSMLRIIRMHQEQKLAATEPADDNSTPLDPAVALVPGVGTVWKFLPKKAKIALGFTAVIGTIAVGAGISKIVVPVARFLDIPLGDEWDVPLYGPIMRFLGIRLWDQDDTVAGPSAAQEAATPVEAAQPAAAAANAPAPTAPASKPSTAARTIARGESGQHVADAGAKTESAGIKKGIFTSAERDAIAEARARGETFRGGRGATTDMRAIVDKAAIAHGQDPHLMETMMQIESAGNPYAVSSTGAVGLFQFTSGTGKQYGITNRFDPVQNANAAAQLLSDNAAALRRAGYTPTPDLLYLTHQQGVGGVIQMLETSSGKRSGVSDAVRKNMQANYGDMAAGDYILRNKQVFASAQKAADAAIAKAQDLSSAGNTQLAKASATPSTMPSDKALRNAGPVTAPALTAPASSKSFTDQVAMNSNQASDQGIQEMFTTPEGVVLYH